MHDKYTSITGASLILFYLFRALARWTVTLDFRFLVFGVMSPHSEPSNYNRNAHQWCAVIGGPQTPDRIERHSHEHIHTSKQKTDSTKQRFMNTRLNFLLLFAATQLALQLHQERTQVVCSNKEWKRLAEGLPQWTLDLKAYTYM